MSMVEWKKLGEVCKVLRGKRLTKSQLNESEGYPVLHGGSTPMGYYEEFNRKANTTVVVNTGNAGCVFFYYIVFWSSDACFSLYPNKEIIDKFLYLYVYGCERILKGKIRAGAMPTIDAKAVEDLLIPIPSLSEQQRIVSILDTFTSSISNLKQQIEERRKQYEYERDLLLDLEGKEGVEMKKLGDTLVSLKTGLNPRKNFILNAPDGNNYYITVRELGLFDITPTEKTDKVTDEALKLINNRSNLEVGDVLFSGTGTIGRTALIKEKPTNWNIKEGVYTLKPCKEIINSRYLTQLLHVNSTIDKIAALIVGDPIRSIPMKSLVTIPIPVPSLKTQSRIVSILDTFEASIKNLEEQLALREKQYEYYRNQLLTFE